jgi:hypothetical protein
MQIRCTGLDNWICAILTMFMVWDFSFLAIMRGTIRKLGKFTVQVVTVAVETAVQSHLLTRRQGGISVAESLQ